MHKNKFERGEEMHENRAEFPAPERENLHEIKSELPAQTGEGLHEIKSERSPRREDGARPLTPVTEDLAREVARVMVEGLRRAAGAR